MELLKQKTLAVGTCRIDLPEEESEVESPTVPGYYLDVNGVRCGLVYKFWRAPGNWVLVDRINGTIFGEYPTFDLAANAILDGAWVREIYEETAPDPEAEKAAAAEQEHVLFRMDNPPKGRPGITLIPQDSGISYSDDDDEWDDEDWDDNEEDWDETDEDEETWDDDFEEDDEVTEDELDDFTLDADSDEDDEFDEVWAEDDLDDFEDDDDWDETRGIPTLVPTAAYIIDVARHPIAIYTTLTAGAISWWEAFDVESGMPLWTGQSMSETLRIAPLFLVIAHSVEMSDETVHYLEALRNVFADVNMRQNGEDYVRTGYLKANGKEYLDLLDVLYPDPTVVDSVMFVDMDEDDEDWDEEDL